MALIRCGLLSAAISLTALAWPASAQPIHVKVGVLNDKSGVYADIGGQGSVVAARMAVEDFAEDEPGRAGRGRRGRPPEQARHRRGDCPAMVRPRRRRRDPRRADLLGGAGGAARSRARRTRSSSTPGAGTARADRQAMLAEHDPVDLRHLGAGATARRGAMIKRGGDTWYFLTADYAFGSSLRARRPRRRGEGRRQGARRGPRPVPGHRLLLLPAAGPGLGREGGRARQCGRRHDQRDQAGAEFGLTESGQKLAALLIYVVDVHAIGLQTAQGLMLTEAFYWDLNDGTRAFSSGSPSATAAACRR